MSGLSVHGLHAGYGRTLILTGVDLEVHPGEVVGLAGRNGAGKTTTLRAISGMLPRRAGKLLFDDAPLPPSPRGVARLGVVHVPEGRGVLRSLTVEENLVFGAAAVGKPHGPAERERVLAFFPALGRMLDRKAGLLSGGEQQMLAIARGLMAQPKLLMVDELSLGLAPRVVADVLGGVLSACREQGVALLIVDQNLRALAVNCDRVYVLSGGSTTGYEDAASRTDEFWRSVYF
ncbi:MAG TPA: ABC transporter ATP-binding protein [Candidatus Dormibacteraeota bacterium]|nr:ABC transporter ATP-binding protein [Candidatus Dormibacteraeota bacterium]